MSRSRCALTTAQSPATELSAISSLSFPQYISPPTKNVGAPKTPRSLASSVRTRNACLERDDCASKMIFSGSSTQPARHSSIVSVAAMSRSRAKFAVYTDLTNFGIQGSSELRHAIREAGKPFRGNADGRPNGIPRALHSRSMSRHIYRPLAGYRLNGESFHPTSLNMGPSKKTRQSTRIP